MVMKGITRGACDYLLKPIRIEELKNIWQHVIRKKKKKKTDLKEQNKTNNQDIPDPVHRNAANMVAALGSADPSYFRTGSLNGVGGFQTLSGSGQFPHNNAAFKSFPASGMIGRLNTPSSLFGTHQLGQNLTNSANDQLKFQSAIGCDYLNGVQGIPASVSLVQNFTNVNDAKIPFPILNDKLTDQMPKVTLGSAPSPILGISNNALMLESNPRDTQENSEFPFSLVNNSSCNDIWSSAMHSSRTSSFPPSQCCRQAPAFNITSSTTSLSNQCPDPFTDMHSQNNDVSFQWWDDANVIGSSINSLTPVNGVDDPEGHNSTNSTFHRNSDFNFSNALQMKHDGVIELTGDYSLKPHQVYTMNRIAGSLGHYDDE
ncbi:unnamed protein product [Lupinus luteus]|uniref:Response regulatory domain-containing protein n=1 Tax=Lupinus luteus TaxID=3873 RepID=A0AAV1XPJ3_LUPLU